MGLLYEHKKEAVRMRTAFRFGASENAEFPPVIFIPNKIIDV